LDCAKQTVEDVSASQTTLALNGNNFGDKARRASIGFLSLGGDEYITDDFSLKARIATHCFSYARSRSVDTRPAPQKPSFIQKLSPGA
jgi:hypothetical protein